MNTILHDLRYAVRMWLKSPGLTAVALLTLALGIGLNTAMFSVVHAMGTRTQKLADAESLVVLWGTFTDEPRHGYMAVGALDVLDWRAQAKSFSDMGVYTENGCILSGAGEPERIRALQATSNLLPMLGLDVRLGRLPRLDEDAEGADQIVVLTDRLWQRRYAGDPGVLGQTLLLNDEPHTVVGILPPEARIEELWYDADVLVPLRVDPARIQRGNRSYFAVGRLRPDVTLAQAQAEMDAIAQRLAEMYPKTNGKTGVWLQPIADRFQGWQERVMEVVLLAAVGVILLIACVNLANLLLARATVRSREFAVRAALGAGRGRIIRQLLTESLLLALLGGGLGVLAGVWVLDLTLAALPDAPFSRSDLRLDPFVLGYALAVTLVAALFFGLAPALTAARVTVSEVLKEGAATASGSRGRGRLRHALVVAQLAVAMPLLVCCGLVTKHLIQLRSADLGFDPTRVLTLRIDLPEYRYGGPAQQVAFFDGALRALQAIPGVETAGAATLLPFADFGLTSMAAIVEGRPEPEVIKFVVVTPDYFRVLNVPLLTGRSLTELDLDGGQRVVLINQTLAETYWPQQEALGRQICLGNRPEKDPWATVVGVVADRVRPGLSDPAHRPEMYLPYAQQPQPDMVVVLRTSGAPADAIPAVRAAIRGLDAGLPLYDVRTAAQAVRRWLRDDHAAAGFTGGLAVLALSLASIGLFGVMSYSVAQRRHEIGIRVALGADRGAVRRLILRRCVRLAVGGILIGLVLSIPVGLLVASNLYGVHGADPLTLTLVSGILLGVAVLAGLLPALRATKVEPMAALRCE
ncbi:MAG TPA: ABC transporter permease [Phycisphaerae bacterium]|nr:ABC transporter permease [Phycisphaerae bacterium]HNU44255.1 ABC transporter permease [Phycisphaerae bacterium]